MYITSCLLFSSSFNKTYAVAVTKEEATKKQEGVGSGTARSCTTRYCDCSAEQGRGEASCQPGQHQGKSKAAAFYQEKAPAS